MTPIITQIKQPFFILILILFYYAKVKYSIVLQMIIIYVFTKFDPQK